MARGFEQLKSTENSAAVYLTPNIYHEIGEETAYELWVPIANEGGEELQQFIDDLGTAWFDYEDLIGKAGANTQGRRFRASTKSKNIASINV